MSPVKEEPENMDDISVTLLTFHLLRSPVREALENMLAISATIERSGTPASSAMVRLVHPMKALAMSVHCLVFSPHRSMVRICPAEVLLSPKIMRGNTPLMVTS